MVQINLFLIFFVLMFAVRSTFEVVLNRLNVRHLRRAGREVPGAFKGLVDPGKMVTMLAYTVDSARFGLITNVFNRSLTLAVILSGILPWLMGSLTSLVSNGILEGLLFFALVAVLLNVPQIPFDLYETFVIEERYGFNTKTLRIWFLDVIKQIVLSAVLGGIMIILLLVLIHNLRQTWWIWAWMILALFEALILWLYPVVIAPWFNRFEPIQNEGLERRIRDLLKEAGLGVGGIFQMDAERRTRHTNAYFTGLGRTKRVVLFDSLLHSHTEDEILAILSHELGHWKRGHLIKLLVVLALFSLLGIFLIARLLEWPILYETFGFSEPIAAVGLFLGGTLLSQVAFFARPLVSAISRKFEREADRMALKFTGTAASLGRALRKLAVHNLANLNPHPLYVWFYYSHPPVVERIEWLKRMEGATKFHETESTAL